MGGRIVVHSLDQARAALAAAASLKRPVVLASAPGAGCYAGPAWFKALAALAQDSYPEAQMESVLDCGADSGVALAALRQGVKRVGFSGGAEARAKLEEIAHSVRRRRSKAAMRRTRSICATENSGRSPVPRLSRGREIGLMQRRSAISAPEPRETPWQLTKPVQKILDAYESDNPRHQGQPRPHPDAGQARRHRQAGDPAGRPGLRARPGAQLRAQPAGLRPALPLPARDRGRAVRLCRAARA